MKRNICTLFDKNYLFRSMALYHSLCEHCPDFLLWMLCMDNESYELLQKLQLINVKLLKLSEVEDDQLLKVKLTRTSTEYCWMFSSSLPLYILEINRDLDMIAYIDADIFFYNSIENIYHEFGCNSIMIIPHNYSDKYKSREQTSGIYNVGMMIFRNDSSGLECLRWWKNRVMEWCYNRYEDGKFGDQLYLNDWPTRFHGIYILRNLGANIAPWNIDSYRFSIRNGEIIGAEKETNIIFPLIFYHFHGLIIYINKKEKIEAYPIVILNKTIYYKYIEVLQEQFNKIKSIDKKWNFGFAEQLNIIKLIKQYIQRFF